MPQVPLTLSAAALLVSVANAGVIRVPADSMKLRMVHVSDTHYHASSCSSVTLSPCDQRNTTQLLKSIFELEKPDLVVHTGDIVDGNSVPAKEGMDALYGCAIDAKLPWAASLGNHDEEADLTRDEVLQYIESMPGGPLTQYGPVAGSPGNFHVDVLGVGDSVVARLVFFDSRIDSVTEMINDAQVAWFENLTSSLPAVPTLAFYHIPIKEYQSAVDAGLPVSGEMHEGVCADGPNEKVFPALKAGNVVAGFCGHDHTNDFCVEYEGVNLCYEGSPGFTAYGNPAVQRRARVTELQLTPDGAKLQAVRSWKRVDGGGSVAGPKVDDEELWAAGGTPEQRRRPVPAEVLANLGERRYTKAAAAVL